MSYLCPFCEHGQFFKGQHSPKDPCTHYVDRLGAECGCVGRARGPLKAGLDDGPELPSQAVRDRTAARIEAERIITDAERINWMEKIKYLETGIIILTGCPVIQVRFRDHGNLKQFNGRSLRGAIDAAIKGDTA